MDERLELELDLASDGHDGFQVAVRSPAGDEHGVFVLAAKDLLGQRPQLQSTILASAVTSRAAVSEIEVPVRLVGETLFKALFHGDVYAAYKASLAVAAERGAQLRVVLRTQVPELAALPWEMLYDPDAGAYLCQREPLVRHVSVPSLTKPLTVTPPLRVLGVVSAPTDKARLDVEGEKQRLRDALAPLGSRVLLRWVDGGRWADVQRELVAGTWHVLHFVGHGGFDDFRQEGVLVLENDQRRSDLVGADRFSDLLTLQVPPLQLVVLNSCAGGQSADGDVFSSTAATLIRTGVSAVVAMQFAVSDPAAKAFAAGFYQAIAHDRALGEAVRIGRIGIRGTGEETLEWITPVIYLRGNDAPLFTVLPGDDSAHGGPPGLAPEEAARQAATEALDQQAIALIHAEKFAEALPVLDQLLSLRPDHREAGERRAQATVQVRVGEAYAAAEAAELGADWVAAVEGYERVLDLDPDRPGVRQRLDHCRWMVRVRALQEQLRTHVEAEDWEAAVAVADDLGRLAPEDSDPDGLATEARARLADGRRRPALGRRFALAGVALALLAGAVFWLWPDGGEGSTDASVPAPFRSAALFELARHHFDPDNCRVVQSRDEAPVLWNLDHTELLVCDRVASTYPDSAYSGSLVCTGDGPALDRVREKLLARAAAPPEEVDLIPAGRDEQWPSQVAYEDAQYGGAGRVLWEDGSGCLVLLRTPEPGTQVALDHFVEGNGS